MGVSLRVDLLFIHATLKIEVGADLELWGPPTGGNVTVHLWIISFTIAFGPAFGQGNDYLNFNDFHTLLPKDAKQPAPRAFLMAAAMPAAPPVPLKNVIKLTINQGQYPQPRRDGRWLVRSDEFRFTVETAFPLTELDLAGPKAATQLQPPQLLVKDPNAPVCARASDGYYVGVRPMGINCASSILTLTITDEQSVIQDLDNDWLWVELTRAVPEAVWGQALPQTQTPTDWLRKASRSTRISPPAAP